MASPSLTEANIERITRRQKALQNSYLCKVCGQIWPSNLKPGGYQSLGWWKCPNGCNETCMDDRID